jgi:cytochrome c peroxidase
MIPNNATIALLIALISGAISPVPAATEAEGILRDEPIKPIPLPSDLNPDKVALGELLFNDTRLSLNNKIACATCHQLEAGGDDNQKIGIAHDNGLHVINTPTIFNSRYNFRQNWDGSVKNLAGQIDKVVHSHLEANTNWTELISELRQDTKIYKRFTLIYSEGLTRDTYVDALTEYEKTLVTPNSRFDQYLRGDDNAITEKEKQGYKVFKELGCISCHQGINVGGNLFQKLGIFYDYFAFRGDIQHADYGRMNVTEKQSDMHVFKVPSLRNIEVTGPYLHDGNAETLEEAVIIMGRTQLGREIKTKEVDLIVEFLKTLTGEYNNKSLKEESS